MKPEDDFHDPAYLRRNARRLEHLATLGLPLRGKTVLEVGAGIGDHTSFYLDCGCTVTAIDARPENVEILHRTHPTVSAHAVDVDADPHVVGTFQIVHCYGLLYHLSKPAEALDWMAGRCTELLLLETCVSYGVGSLIGPTPEDPNQPSQSFHGLGCRPTRRWVFEELKSHFPHVYVTRTQPNCWDFPLDWGKMIEQPLKRAVFVASWGPLDLPTLLTELPGLQERAP